MSTHKVCFRTERKMFIWTLLMLHYGYKKYDFYIFYRLNFGMTKIGRGQNNNYFLDSLKLKNFISRYHAEIIGTKNENGEVEFVLTDKGLNGTFINDYRVFKIEQIKNFRKSDLPLPY